MTENGYVGSVCRLVTKDTNDMISNPILLFFDFSAIDLLRLYVFKLLDVAAVLYVRQWRLKSTHRLLFGAKVLRQSKKKKIKHKDTTCSGAKVLCDPMLKNKKYKPIPYECLLTREPRLKHVLEKTGRRCLRRPRQDESCLRGGNKTVKRYVV